MTLLLRVAAALLAAAVAVVAWRELELGPLLGGRAPGYDASRLAFAVGAGLAVSVCVLLLRRPPSARTAVLLLVPLGVLAAAPAVPRTSELVEVVYDGSYVPLGASTSPYSSSLTLQFDGAASPDLVLVTLALGLGAALPLLALRRPLLPGAAPAWLRGASLAAALVGALLAAALVADDLRLRSAFGEVPLSLGRTDLLAFALAGAGVGLCLLAASRLRSGRAGALLLVGPYVTAVCVLALAHGGPVSFGWFAYAPLNTVSGPEGGSGVAALAAGAAAPLLLLARDLRRH